MLNFSKSMVVVFVAMVHCYFYFSSYVEKLDYKLYDLSTQFFNEVLEKKNATYSVVVDIDEASLETFGQWPWSRITIAKLIQEIDKMSPSAIGINILSSEKDRASPLSMQEFYKEHFGINIDLDQFPTSLQDNDKYFAKVLKQANVTLPVYLQNGLYSDNHCASLSYKHNYLGDIQTRLSGNRLLCNHVSIQENIENFGLINAQPDNDGIFRRVPLFMNYKEEVFPSFALAIVLSIDKYMAFNKEEESVLVNFSTREPKVIRVSDIFNGTVEVSDIQGKIVILGSSILGLNSAYNTPNGTQTFKTMIQALLVDNILNEAFLIQPQEYKVVNILLSFIFSLIFILLLIKKDYFNLLILTLVLMCIAVMLVLIMYFNGVYISIGYLWIPLLSTSILFVLYHLKVISKEQQAQEHFLIRQSKLASMGEMISLIAHQWRQPLSSINGTVLSMDIDYRKEKLSPEKFDGYLNEIEATTAYLSKTINDFRDFFSQEKERHLFSMSKIIEQVTHLASISLSDEVQIIHRQNEVIEVNGYSSELVQSLLVLVNNAIYICNKNLEHIDKGKIFIDVVRVRKNVRISVEDNGGGIATKDIKKVFDPYFTTKEKQHGTGLGLYILKMIVEDSMNGKVSVINGKKGAIFTIEIPMNV